MPGASVAKNRIQSMLEVQFIADHHAIATLQSPDVAAGTLVCDQSSAKTPDHDVCENTRPEVVAFCFSSTSNSALLDWSIGQAKRVCRCRHFLAPSRNIGLRVHRGLNVRSVSCMFRASQHSSASGISVPTNSCRACILAERAKLLTTLAGSKVGHRSSSPPPADRLVDA